MLRLNAFGGVALTRDGSPVIAAVAPRRLALLVLVAAAGERGISREAIAGLLWPDSDPEEGRHSLHQMLYLSRQAFGAPDLYLGNSSLLLNPAYIECDIWEFESALRARQPERAIALYRGPFADGLTVKGAPEMERRLESIRIRYARDWALALETLARAASERRDFVESARWWQRLLESDQLSTRAAKELITALVAAGEAARALQFALVHEAIVRQETGRAPDREITHWIQRLRADPASSLREAKSATAVGIANPRHTDDVQALQQRRAARLANALGRRYRLEHLLEEGSIAATYSAIAMDGRPVEVQHVQVRMSTASLAKCMAALQRAMTLVDPRILPTIDVGLVDDLLFYVSARRSRPSLRERLRRERALPVREGVKLGLETAVALAHAHANGVYHGDLRPKHIGLAGDSPIIGAFGLVQGLSNQPEAGIGTTVVAVGSPKYLSPEQLSGNVHVDARSDIYALGCILYEMLVGEAPFGGYSPGLVGRKLTESPPRVREYRESVSEPVELIVRKCLMRIPADRYASADELAQALGEAEAAVR